MPRCSDEKAVDSKIHVIRAAPIPFELSKARLELLLGLKGSRLVQGQASEWRKEAVADEISG